MPFNIGAPELIIILVIALLIIGPGKLPDVGQALGKSIREFRKASSDIQEAVKVDASPLPAQPTAAPPVAAQPVAPPPAIDAAPEAVAPGASAAPSATSQPPTPAEQPAATQQ